MLSMQLYVRDSLSSLGSHLGKAHIIQLTPASPLPEPPTHRKENFLNEGK